MSQQIIIDVKTSKNNNKVYVRDKRKKDKYTQLFTAEIKSFISHSIQFVESLGKVLFYLFVLAGLFFQELAKKQKAKRKDSEKNNNKLF